MYVCIIYSVIFSVIYIYMYMYKLCCVTIILLTESDLSVVTFQVAIYSDFLNGFYLNRLSGLIGIAL